MAIAKMIAPLLPKQVASTPLDQIRVHYNKLATAYNKIADCEIVYCHGCNSFYSRTEFYSDKNNASGVMCYCKECLKKMACDFDKSLKTYSDNKKKAMRVLQMIDKPYLDEVYQTCIADVKANPVESKVTTGWNQYMRQLMSGYSNYRNLTWNDSKFEDGDTGKAEIDLNEENKQLIKMGKKRFGEFPDQDLIILAREYQDWITRYECNTKAQEKLFESLAFNELETYKARKSNASTKDLEKTRMELLNTANITPRQQVTDPTSNAQVFGTLIQRWEETRPLPEVEDDLKDVDKIGLLIEVFFRGHMAKMLDLKNPLSHIYEKFMAKYTVKPPTYDEENDSEVLFDKIFGASEEE